MSVVSNEHGPCKTLEQTAIHCRGVSKAFYEPARDSRSWRNGFLGKRKKLKAVNQVSFDVCKNEVFGLLGSNGSGKSTLIRLFATLSTLDEGVVRIFGFDISTQKREVRRLINRVSVEASFFKKLTALENLRYVSRLYGLTKAEGEQKASQILKRLGIGIEKVNIPLESFSRGMQQKVAIARAFMTSPTLILLDEPTTGLDPKSKRDVQYFVKEVMSTQDVTIILTTHDMDEADQLCDRIAIIDDGRIVAIDTAENLKRLVAAKSLEEAFFRLTGKEWSEVQSEC